MRTDRRWPTRSARGRAARSAPAAACDAILLRKKREIPLPLVRDPFLRAPLPLLCRACGEPAFAVHACDEAGHLTCSSCAAPCARCGRVTCRQCVPAGCKVCARG